MSFGVGRLGAGVGKLGTIARLSGGCVKVGGVCVGSAGTSGIYSGYTLTYGDEFNSLDAVGPSNPNGKYFMTRGYGFSSGPSVGFRTVASVPQWSIVDPNYTGYLDANRGVPFGFTNVRTASSILSLQCRAATTAESAMFPTPATQINVAAVLNSDGVIGFYPGSACSIIVEARMRFKRGAGLAGWYAILWTISNAPIAYTNADECDVAETVQTDDTTLDFGTHQWVNRVATINSAISNWNSASFYDGNFHLYTVELTHTTVKVSGDGALQFSLAQDSNPSQLPQYFIIDSRQQPAANGFVQSAWTTSGTTNTSGCTVDVDYARVWRTTGAPHFTPKASISDLLVDYNGTGSRVLPAAATLWGTTPDQEYVQTRPLEPNEPGTDVATSYQQFPSGITYNSGTRTISVDFSAVSGSPGRSHGMVAAWNTTGSTFNPARFSIMRGPNITTTTLSTVVNTTYTHDLYFECPVGILTPKVITCTGLPAGLTFDGVSVISGTPTSVADTTITIGCTNSAGQSISKNITLSVTSGIVFSLTNTAHVTDTIGGTTVNYSASFGTADTNRIISVVAGARTGATVGITSMTIGGVAATQVAGAAANVGTTSCIDIWQAPVPTGSSGTVSIVWNSASSRSAIGVFRIITGTPTATASAHNSSSSTANGGTLSASLTAPAGGAAISALFGRGLCANPCLTAESWSAAMTSAFFQSAFGGGSTMGAAISNTTGALTVTATITSAGGEELDMASAAWGP